MAWTQVVIWELWKGDSPLLQAGLQAEQLVIRLLHHRQLLQVMERDPPAARLVVRCACCLTGTAGAEPGQGGENDPPDCCFTCCQPHLPFAAAGG
jgi:hypothetical protein